MAARQRTNFPKAVRTAALERADGRCEADLPSGERCPCPLQPGWYVFDHDTPDALGGPATLENCKVRCVPCDRVKTPQDQAAIADAKRAYDAHHRLRAPRKPMAGSRFDRATRGLDGLTRDRTTGAVLSRPGSIDVRKL